MKFSNDRSTETQYTFNLDQNSEIFALPYFTLTLHQKAENSNFEN